MFPIAIGQLLAAAEALTVGDLYGKKSLLRGVSSRNTKPGTIKHRVAELIDSPQTPKILAASNILSSSALLVSRRHRKLQIAACALIATSNRINEIRTPYGRDGADQMTSVITQYRALSSIVPGSERSDELFLRSVNIQAGMSYHVSGISKLFGSSWLRGTALGDILSTQSYGHGPAASILKSNPALMRLITWSTPVWESLFPLVYMVPEKIYLPALDIVKLFHVGIASVMELPRFLWGFSAAHGSIRYVCDSQLRGHKTFSRFERYLSTAAIAAATTSVIHGAHQRQLDVERRQGLKGTKVLQLPDGDVEFIVKSPPLIADSEANELPIVLLESGLGNALEAWSWVTDDISNHCHVVAYHRRGYGRTTSNIQEVNILDALVKTIRSDGPIISVSHSIGSVKSAEYINRLIDGRMVSAAVIVDGTDPDLLKADRSSSERVGKFIQSQVQSMFASISGIYNFAPNAVDRQSAYTPDYQRGTVQFAYSPKNIYTATKEYFSADAESVFENFSSISTIHVIGSGENEQQQRDFANKLGATFSVVEDSSHRSILGYRRFAKQVSNAILGVVSEC